MTFRQKYKFVSLKFGDLVSLHYQLKCGERGWLFHEREEADLEWGGLGFSTSSGHGPSVFEIEAKCLPLSAGQCALKFL